MGKETIQGLLSDMTKKDIFVSDKIQGNVQSLRLIDHYDQSQADVYIIADVGGHFVNVLGVNSDGTISVHNTDKNGPSSYDRSTIQGIYVIQEF
jgi:hypothetical protein